MSSLDISQLNEAIKLIKESQNKYIPDYIAIEGKWIRFDGEWVNE